MLGNIQLLLQFPVSNIGFILDGIFVGAIFALAAYGLALVWGVTNVKNLAQGDFVILGGFLTWFMMAKTGLHPLIGMWITIPIMFCFGWLMHHLIIKWVIDRDMFTSLLSTFGLAIVLQQLMSVMFGSEVQIAESGLGTWFLFDGMVSVSKIRVVAAVLCIILALIIVIFMRRSRMGQSIRATSQDARAARVMGINTDRVYAFTFALNAAICGAAGSMVAMVWNIQPFYGINYSIRAFVIVISAGLGNLGGVIAAAFGLGTLEQYGGFVLGAEFQQAIVTGALILVLIWRIFVFRRRRQAVA